MFWEELVGVRVLDAKLTDGNIMMKIQNGVDIGFLLWSPEGDCCSQSWIEHVDGLENLQEQTILEAWTAKQPHFDPNDEEECLKVYFYKLRTTAGYVDIDMRNSSNGYYGGFLDCPVEGKTLVRYLSSDLINKLKKREIK
jgi:hypothetical protein